MTSGEILQWVGVLGAGGWALELIRGFLARRKQLADTDKTKAEASAVISRAAADMLEPLTEQVAWLTAELKNSRTEHTRQMASVNAELRETREELSWTQIKLKEINAALDAANSRIAAMLRKGY